MEREERIKVFTDLLGDICPDGFIERLEAEGYFEAPAGMKHHGAYEGGLFDHSLQVAYELQNLTLKLGLTWERANGPLVVGLLHDLCKVKQYIKTPIEEVEISAGSEKQITTHGHYYAWNEKQNLPGHGEASIFRIMEWGGPQLKADEMYCIRYHMEAYQQQEWKELDAAIRQYPNIIYTHLADMIASKLKGV